MIKQISKDEIRRRIHTRIRRKVKGSEERPRLAVFRSVANIYAQVIDDRKGRTLVAASSIEKAAGHKGGKVCGANGVAKLIAEPAQAKGLKKGACVRGGYPEHRRLASSAGPART